MAAKNKFLNAMKMPSIDDMFSSEADRQRESGDLVTEVPLSELHPFVGHPFEVRDDEDMQKLVDSIRENGVLTNLTVRRRTEGGYEIISGHRRFHAAQRAGLDRVKVQVRDIDDDQAIIDMVDSNIQREHISPMEKARAYAMKLEAISRQGARQDLTSAQVGRKLESADIVGKEAGDSRMQVRRYIRLNSLVPDLQKNPNRIRPINAICTNTSLRQVRQHSTYDPSSGWRSAPQQPAPLPFGAYLASDSLIHEMGCVA